MATQEERQIKSQFEALSKNAVLDIVLPRTAEFDISRAIRSGSPEDVQNAPARRNLFFDERAIITLLLKSSAKEDSVRAILPSLEITLSAHATDAVPQGNGNAASASGKHDLTSKIVSGSEFTDVVSNGSSIYVVWSPILQMSRPRARLQRPAVYFTAYLTVSSKALTLARQSGKDFLTSLEPLPTNVLEVLQFDPTLGDSQLHLPETRITKVAPSTGRVLDDVRPVRSASKRAFPIVPALFTKVRYSYLPDAVVASLHLEASQLIPGTVLLKDVSFEVPSVNIEKLNSLEGSDKMMAGDETVLLYKLKKRTESSHVSPAAVSVQVKAAVLPEDDNQIELDLNWQAQVDMSKKSTEPTYRWSRPLSMSGPQHSARPSLQIGSRPTSMDATQQPPQLGEHGVTFNFWTSSTLPPKKVFTINVQCINQSNRVRRFAIVVVQPKKGSIKKHEHSTSGEAELINKIFNASPAERQRPPDVFDLNPDVRIGPLPPGACYETQLKFWAATTGVLDLGVVKIVDLDTRQTVEVKELPDIIALDPKED